MSSQQTFFTFHGSARQDLQKIVSEINFWAYTWSQTHVTLSEGWVCDWGDRMRCNTHWDIMASPPGALRTPGTASKLFSGVATGGSTKAVTTCSNGWSTEVADGSQSSSTLHLGSLKNGSTKTWHLKVMLDSGFLCAVYAFMPRGSAR